MRISYFASAACLVLGASYLTPSAGHAQENARILVDFESTKPGATPAKFSVAVTGEGGAARWIVEAHTEAGKRTNVLAQRSAIDANTRFPVCVYEDFTGKDVDVSMRFKPLSGKLDQAGGIVWRYRDANNYYIVRANALENNVVLYKMQNGKRTDLKPRGSWLFSYGKSAKVPLGAWSALRVVAKARVFSVYLNGEHLFDVEDETFQGPGKVGFWTKADSITLFDDLAIVPMDKPR